MMDDYLLETKSDFDTYRCIQLDTSTIFISPEPCLTTDGINVNECVTDATVSCVTHCYFGILFRINFDEPIVQVTRDYQFHDEIDPIRPHLSDPITYLRLAGLDV